MSIPLDKVRREALDQQVPVVEVIRRHDEPLVRANITEGIATLRLSVAAARNECARHERKLNNRLDSIRGQEVHHLIASGASHRQQTTAMGRRRSSPDRHCRTPAALPSMARRSCHHREVRGHELRRSPARSWQARDEIANLPSCRATYGRSRRIFSSCGRTEAARMCR